MLLSPVAYVRPSSLPEALQALQAHDNARVLAGGQTLINVMKTRFASPEVVVDLAGVAGLDAVAVGADGTLTIGSMVTYDTIDRSEAVRGVRPVLSDVATVIADQQVRNRGTIGGNICASDPTNHFPPLLVALGATMTIAGSAGERTVSADEFFAGVYMTAVDANEILTSIEIPAPATSQGDAFESLTIGKEGTGIVTVAVSLRCNGTIEQARVVVGCVSATPVRATSLEDALEGAAPTSENIDKAAQGLGGSLDPPSDVHASAEYRSHIAEVIARRAVTAAVGKAMR